MAVIWWHLLTFFYSNGGKFSQVYIPPGEGSLQKCTSTSVRKVYRKEKFADCFCSDVHSFLVRFLQNLNKKISWKIYFKIISVFLCQFTENSETFFFFFLFSKINFHKLTFGWMALFPWCSMCLCFRP